MKRLSASALLAVAVGFGLSSCAELDRNVGSFERPVSSVAVGDAAEVSALHLARAMLEAGFSRDEILDYGPSIRNSLATSGAAQVKDGGQVLALMSIYDQKLYIVTRSRGTIVYPL